ncbi:MAG: hypothetical protein V3V05_01535 [Pontiella sp.]
MFGKLLVRLQFLIVFMMTVVACVPTQSNKVLGKKPLEKDPYMIIISDQVFFDKNYSEEIPDEMLEQFKGALHTPPINIDTMCHYRICLNCSGEQSDDYGLLISPKMSFIRSRVEGDYLLNEVLQEYFEGLVERYKRYTVGFIPPSGSGK